MHASERHETADGTEQWAVELLQNELLGVRGDEREDFWAENRRESDRETDDGVVEEGGVMGGASKVRGSRRESAKVGAKERRVDDLRGLGNESYQGKAFLQRRGDSTYSAPRSEESLKMIEQGLVQLKRQR